VAEDIQTQLQRTALALKSQAARLTELPPMPPVLMLRLTVEAAADCCAEASAVFSIDPVAAVRHVHAAYVLVRTNGRSFEEITEVMNVDFPPEIAGGYADAFACLDAMWSTIA
jgi:hypothetical protein